MLANTAWLRVLWFKLKVDYFQITLYRTTIQDYKQYNLGFIVIALGLISFFLMKPYTEKNGNKEIRIDFIKIFVNKFYVWFFPTQEKRNGLTK